MATRTVEDVCGSSSIFRALSTSLPHSFSGSNCLSSSCLLDVSAQMSNRHLISRRAKSSLGPASCSPASPQASHPPIYSSSFSPAFPPHVIHAVSFTPRTYPVITSTATTLVPATISSDLDNNKHLSVATTTPVSSSAYGFLSYLILRISLFYWFWNVLQHYPFKQCLCHILFLLFP